MSSPAFIRLQTQALKYLSLRPRSELEVRQYLTKKTPDVQLIESVVQKLKQVKFINDSEFAVWFAQSRSRTRPRAVWLIKRELKQKGIIDFSPDSISDEDSAQTALSARLRRLENLAWPEFRLKASRFLASRGFSASTIEKIVKKTYNDLHVIEAS